MVCLQALSLFVLIISLNIFEVYLLHGFSSLKPLAFFQVLRRLAGVCIVEALSCWFTNVKVNQKGLLSIRLFLLEGLLWVCTLQSRSADSFWSHVRNHILRLLLLPLLLYSPCPPIPRVCLERDDSKKSKFDLFRSTGHAWSVTTRTSYCKGWRLCSSYRALSWILHAFFSASRRAYLAPCPICLCVR